MLLKNIYQRRYNCLQNILSSTRSLTSKTMDIQNFVFFDIETTGLPHEEYNKTRITEMCFVVVQKEHISLGVYPRVQNKLNLCFNPSKMISPMASRITGLTNDLLEFQSSFGPEACNIINTFLELQRKPLCFVAHNGNRFDYPIFKTELYNAGCQLIDNILCIDSLQMFRDLEREKNIAPEQSSPNLASHTNHKVITQRNVDVEIHDLPTQKNIAVGLCDETHQDKTINQRDIIVDVHDLPTQKNIPIELCDEFDELLFSVVDQVEISSTSNKEKKIQYFNENTPKKFNQGNSHKHNHKVTNALQDHLYYSPPQHDRSSNAHILRNPVAKEHPAARKMLNFGAQSYKLTDVYTRLTKKVNENAHLADQDVNMLIECAATLGQDFVDWANTNAKMFSDIPMMKPGVKLGL